MTKKIKKRYFVLVAFFVTMVLALLLGSGCIITGGIPGAPSNLVAVAVLYNQIDLTWQDNSNNENGFKVRCSTGSTYYSEIANLPPNTREFTHSNLDPLDTYNYYVQAYNNDGKVDSNIAEATTLSGVTILDSVLGENFYGKALVTGHARNDTNEMLSWVKITVWFYDAFDLLLDTDYIGETDIPGGVTWRFEILDPFLRRDEVARFDIAVTDVRI